MTRKPIIAGNWKMNNTKAQATELINALKPLVKDAECDVVICVPYTVIETAAKLTATGTAAGGSYFPWLAAGSGCPGKKTFQGG